MDKVSHLHYKSQKYSYMSTRCNVIIKKGEDEILLYRHWDGYPSVTGRNLLSICNESNYDTLKVIKSLAKSGNYELSAYKHDDADYEYVVDLDNRRIYAVDLFTKESFDEADF